MTQFSNWLYPNTEAKIKKEKRKITFKEKQRLCDGQDPYLLV